MWDKKKKKILSEPCYDIAASIYHWTRAASGCESITVLTKIIPGEPLNVWTILAEQDWHENDIERSEDLML